MKHIHTLVNLLLIAIIALPLCSFSQKKFDAEIEKGYEAEDAGRFEEAITIYNKVLKTVPADSLSIISDIHSGLLLCHLRLGHIGQALISGEECLRLDELQGDNERISSSLSNLASLFVSADRFDDAESFLKRSLKLEREAHNNEKIAIRLGMLCELYTKMKQPAKALPLAREALAIDEKDKRENKAAIRMSQLGNVLVCLHRSKEAMPYLTKALELHRKYTNHPSENITLVTLGMAEHDLGNNKAAEDYLMQSIALSESIGQLHSLVTAYLELSKIYKETNDPRAFSFLEKHIELKDSLNSLQVQNQISGIEVKYQVYQKEQELEKRQQIIKIQRIGYVGLIIVLLLTFAFIFFLVRTIRLKNINIAMRNKFMQILSHDLKNPALAQQKSLHLLANTIENSETSETTETSNTSDSLLPTLKSMVNYMAEDADSYVNLLYSLLDWTQLQAGQLKPVPIEFDLSYVTNEVISQHHAQAEIKHVTITFSTDEDSHITYADKQMTFAILRNLISNAIKFSYPEGEVKIDIKGTLVLIENGQGFGQVNEERGTGLGLNLVEKLAKLNQISCKICKKIEENTVVELQFNTK